MYAAPPLLSFLLILLYHSGWTYGLCQMENITAAWCHSLQDVKYIDGHLLESLKAPATQDTLKPSLFDSLSNLRHLDMSGGSLKKIEPGSFRALSNLRSLNLGDNPLEYLELASLEGLTHLRSLNLHKNAIRQLPPALARLKNLRHLDIHGNPLECNCATLKVRDLIAQRGVLMSKKVTCMGPGSTKGTSLMKPNAAIICNLEEQDREMQNDQPVGSGMDSDSGDVLDELSEENVEDEYVEVHNVSSSSEKPREPEVETPFPAISLDSTTEYSTTEPTAALTELTVAPKETTGTTTSSLQSTAEDEEIFFDNEEKKERSTTTEMSRQEENIKDGLYYPPTTDSGDEDEGSGEGSGTGSTHFDEEMTSKNDASDQSLIGMLWETVFGTTASPTKDPELEEEQFMVAPPEEPRNIHSIESDASKASTVETKITTARSTSGVEVIKPDASNESKSGNVKVEVDELTEESSSKQSKKGMGSYVVLAALLAVLVALIGCAAYKGNCCKKKKKREDVETGTELKDVQKSLIPDDENTTQPKIASNGNAENASLVENTSENDQRYIIYNGDMFPPDPSTYLRPIKPHHSDSEEIPENDKNGENGRDVSPIDDRKVEERPRVDVNALKENFFAEKTSPVQASASSALVNNGPVSEPNESPVSSEAQKVKITLQEIPDSVPKTPILITRTMAGENLVKTP